MKVYRFFLLLLFFSCGYRSIPQHCKEADRIMLTHAKQVKKSDNFGVMGTGGAFMDDVKEILLVYQVNIALEPKDARRLYVKTASSLLELINNDEKIRPYLHQYPFTI